MSHLLNLAGACLLTFADHIWSQVLEDPQYFDFSVNQCSACWCLCYKQFMAELHYEK